MTDGTSQGLFIVVAIVIFGIFTVLAYILFEDTLSPAMASMFNNAIEKTQEDILYEQFKGKNLLPDSTKTMTYLDRITYGTWGPEYMQYADVSPIFNKFGEGKYTISFDLQLSEPGNVRVYAQNGYNTQYNFSRSINVKDTDWNRYAVNVTVLNQNKVDSSIYHPSMTLLSFYSTYRTGRIASVKNVKVELGHVKGVPLYSEMPSNLSYD